MTASLGRFLFLCGVAALLIGAATVAVPAVAQSVAAIGSTARARLIGSVRGDAEGNQIARAMDARLARMRPLLPLGVRASRLGEGIVIIGPGHDGGLGPWDQTAVIVRQELQNDPTVTLFIVAHSSGRGDEARDLRASHALGEVLQEAVAGGDADLLTRLSFVGRGRQEPIVSNATPDGQRSNSRVELAFHVPPAVN